MLTFEECLALCELEEDEVDAIAEHEHVSEITAIELGNYLVHTEGGIPRIQRMIADDIAEARSRGDLGKAARLRMVLKHFVETHGGGGGEG